MFALSGATLAISPWAPPSGDVRKMDGVALISLVKV